MSWADRSRSDILLVPPARASRRRCCTSCVVGRSIRPHDGVCRGRNGLRDGGGEDAMSSTSEVTIGGLVGTRWKPALSVEVTDGIAVITFDLPNESVNKLSRAVKDEFVALVSRLERDTSITAAVLLSGKPDIFIAGADIEEFL